MPNRILFLDIDGVLNGHDWHEGAQSNTLRRGCVVELSRILEATRCVVVLSSAWRYVIHSRNMTCSGFELLLRSHGSVGIAGKIVGVTARDEDCPHCGHKHRRGGRGRWNEEGYWVCIKCGKPGTRGHQIAAWLRDHHGLTAHAVAIDDEDYGITEAGIHLVQTDGATGLLSADADRVIELLNNKE